ncbi:MAG: sterol desaturase/sphingolipid hydroxylase (fatty acid hydroxylase superfamily) [Polaribacter sp.]
MPTITTTDVYAVGIPIIVVLICLEAVFSAFKNRQFYKRGDTGGTIGLLAGNVFVSLLTQGLILSLYFFLYQLRVFTVNDVMPIWTVWLLTLVMIDFVFYWYHRSSHRIRLLWAIHMNHHSSVEMNFSVAFRQAWFGPISKVPFFIIMPLLGFDPSITVVVAVFSTLWGVLGHTQWIDKLGWLDGIFNTPSTHRVHHGTNPEYIDSNYGNFFIVWDRLFGTYSKEQAPVIFGLVKNLQTNNPVKITFYTWSTIVSDVKGARSFDEVVGYIFGPPDWSPKDTKNSSQ